MTPLFYAAGLKLAGILPVPGRELKGVYQAMYYLPQQNLRDNKISDR